MASLTETAYYTKKFLKIGIFSFVLFLIFRVIFIQFQNWWIAAHPPPEIPPAQAFGKINPVRFPTRGTQPQYYPVLETIGGAFPAFKSNKANIYFIPQQKSNIYVWERARAWARRVGFTDEPEKKDEFTYIFRSIGSLSREMELNVVTGNFTLITDYQNSFGFSSSNNAPSKEFALSEASKFLTEVGIFANDLKSGYQEFTYLTYNPPNLETAISPSEADFVRVSFFRQPIEIKDAEDKIIESYKILPPDFQEALISVLVSGANDPQKRIIEVKYIHFPISRETSSDYYLLPIQEAWKQLQENRAFLANFGQNYDGRVVVRNIYLAYFDPVSPPEEQETLYLQPIYVFEGDRDFVAYVPALDLNSFTGQNLPK